MAEDKTYELRTVADFLNVPSDVIHDCMEDFTMWATIGAAFREAKLENVTFNADVFRWTDDGKHDARVKVSIRREEPPSVDAVDPVDRVVEG